MSDTSAWLTPQLQAQYEAVWAHGLQGALMNYVASPLRPPTADDPGAGGVELPSSPALGRWESADDPGASGVGLPSRPALGRWESADDPGAGGGSCPTT